MEKEEFHHLQTQILATFALLGSLVDEMHEKGLINKDSITNSYDNNLQQLIDQLFKK